jgi:TolB-like protein
VLPFANVSDDSSNEYFADGLSEELLNVLAKIRGFRVASRTSAFYFKGKDVDLPTIAQGSMWQQCFRVAYAKRATECA